MRRSGLDARGDAMLRVSAVARRLIALLLLILAGAVADARAEDGVRRGDVLVRESVYNHLIVSRTGSVVTFRRLENGGWVGAIDLANPRRQVMPYTGVLFAPALVQCCPSRVFNIGLGAGAFDRLFATAFPAASLVTVEIDPMILEIAETHTDFRRGERMEVVIADGRRYLAQAKGTWDWIVLDAYVRRSQLPAHLSTLEFYRLVAERLSPRGVFVMNLPFGTALFQSLVKTLTTAFAQVVFFPVPERSNVIAMAVSFAAPDLVGLVGAADVGRLPDLKAWDVDLDAIRKSVTPLAAQSIPADAKVLTDDFAPVEFLGRRRAR